MTVSIVTPTTHDRKEFNERCAMMSANQTYSGIIEHLFDYSDNLIGVKRQNLFQQAKGDIIIHFDSDDIYLPQYVELCIAAFGKVNISRVLGLSAFPMHDVVKNNIHVFNNAGYIAEATFAYYRDGFCGFLPKRTNEGSYVMQNMKFTSYVNPYFMATVHGANTCGHKTLPMLKRLPQDEAALILNRFYGI